jgi:Got1/Sft2-like family
MDSVLSLGGLLGGEPEPPPPPPPTGLWAYLPEALSSSSSSSSSAAAGAGSADPCLRLGYVQRMACFSIAFVAGVACCVMASLVVFSPHLFAKYYSLGSLLLLCSTFFLVGPVAQLKSMFHPSR